ncbi:MAG: exo-alpha-sialidase [Phycisphaerales bacterium]|nr:exo-alpha-sialidase [Phycisphaerales bacterium]
MHILADPATSNVWAFYVEFDNRLCGDPAGQQKVSILNCRRSVNNGHDWSVPVQNIPGSVYSTLACGPENFAKLPDEQDDYVLDGFFRIGRVWSCLDSAGRIHVVWMDNREGVHPDPLTYPHRDFWRVYRSVSSDGGLTWSSVVLPVSTASSLGGFGNPHPGSFYPPGDHLGCCADDQYLYVTWPDARHYAEMAPDQAGRIYVRRFNLTP